MSILGVATSLLSGGLSGILGGAIGRVFDFLGEKQKLKVKELDYKHDVDLKKLDMEAADREWAARTQISKQEGEAKIEVADAQAFAESMFKEPTRYSTPTTGWANILLTVLDFIRGIVRPGITVALMVFTFAMYNEIKDIMSVAGVSLTGAQAFAIYEIIVNTVLYLTSTTIGWWFASRPAGKPPKAK